jgi:hypothetical protein
MRIDHLLRMALVLAVLKVNFIAAQNHIAAMRYDDNYGDLKSDSIKHGLSNRIRNIAVAKNLYVSFGGELREQFQVYDNMNFGDVPPTYKSPDPTQLWHRALIHANIESGPHWRFFIQLQNTLRLFNYNPIVPEIDENQFSVHQGFAEYKVSGWRFRLGQQEMAYGNHRVITFREGPNTRLAFDGLVIKRQFQNGSIDFFAVSKVISKQYVLDDESMHDGLLGIYGTQFFSQNKIGLDYFVVNFQSRDRKYNGQSGFENRATCGARLFSRLDKFNFELEAAYQSGKFDALDISAYSITADINISILQGKRAVAGFSASVSSGDKSASDRQLNTYNLLYAKPAYGLAVPIGAANIIGFNPYLKLSPTEKWHILAQAFFLSRHSNEDGIYSPAMAQTPSRRQTSDPLNARTLGQLYVLESSFQASDYVSFSLDVSYFDAGSYIKSVGRGNDITYLSFKTTFKF